MTNNVLESAIGSVVLVIACLFFYFAYTSSFTVKPTDSTYHLFAKFSRIDGINLGADVKISGIPVGKVTDQTLDSSSYQAVLRFNVRNDVKIPADSVAEIVGNGFLGDKYINIQAGADSDMLAPGSSIEFTQASISLESMIGKFLFGLDKHDSERK